MSKTRRLIYQQPNGEVWDESDFSMMIQNMADKGNIEGIIQFFEKKMITYASDVAEDSLLLYRSAIIQDETLLESYKQIIKHIEDNE